MKKALPANRKGPRFRVGGKAYSAAALPAGAPNLAFSSPEM